MKRFAHVMTVITVCGIAVFTSSCGSSRQAAQSDGGQQTEQDILRLLGVEDDADMPAGDRPMGGGSLEERVTELENLLMDKESEINELKAELVLKEEQIDDMQGRPMAPSRTMAPAAPGGGYESQYNQALSIYRNGQYNQAIQEFQRLLSVSMDNALSDNCQYWIGESYYGLKNYRQAIIEFEKVFTFPKSNKDDHAQLKLGLCYINIGDNEKARMEFNRLVTNYPKSDVVGKARQWLARLP